MKRTMLLAAVILSCTKPGMPSVNAAGAPAYDGGSAIVEHVMGTMGPTVDTSLKEAPRTMVPEAYLRTYLLLFSKLTPSNPPAGPDVETVAIGADHAAVFDTWKDYLGSIGLPVYWLDIQRNEGTNMISLATFERLGNALCDRAVEHDWPAAVGDRALFRFDPLPTAANDRASFDQGFDVLHRRMLGYPAKLAPTDRANRFFQLYKTTAAAHTSSGQRFTGIQAAWATVCYGLIRHPEFHQY